MRSDYKNYEDLLAHLGLVMTKREGGRYYVSLTNPALLDFLLAYSFFIRIPTIEFLKLCIRLLEKVLNDLKTREKELPIRPRK